MSEFTYHVTAAKIGADPFEVAFQADERQRAQLAKRYNIMSIESLSGTAALTRETDGMTIAVKGHFSADVTQACVTTLEPVPDHIEEDFEGYYLDESQATSFLRAKKRKAEIDANDLPLEEDESVVADERDEPDAVLGGMIDLGELVAQYLSLALNPYPHSEKALAEGPVGIIEAPEKASPFAVLKDIKGK